MDCPPKDINYHFSLTKWKEECKVLFQSLPRAVSWECNIRIEEEQWPDLKGQIGTWGASLVGRISSASLRMSLQIPSTRVKKAAWLQFPWCWGTEMDKSWEVATQLTYLKWLSFWCSQRLSQTSKAEDNKGKYLTSWSSTSTFDLQFIMVGNSELSSWWNCSCCLCTQEAETDKYWCITISIFI